DCSRRRAPSGRLVAGAEREPAPDLNDENGYKARQEDIGQIMAPGGQPKQARDGAESERGGDRRGAQRRRRQARRGEHPEALRGLAADEGAVFLAGPVEAIPGAEFVMLAEISRLARPRPMGMVFEAQIDDEPGADG